MLGKFPSQKKLRSTGPGPSGTYWSSGACSSSNCRHSSCHALPRSQGTFGSWANLPETATTFPTTGASYLPRGEPGAREKYTAVWLLATQLVPHERWVMHNIYRAGIVWYIWKENSILSCNRIFIIIFYFSHICPSPRVNLNPFYCMFSTRKSWNSAKKAPKHSSSQQMCPVLAQAEWIHFLCGSQESYGRGWL